MISPEGSELDERNTVYIISVPVYTPTLIYILLPFINRTEDSGRIWSDCAKTVVCLPGFEYLTKCIHPEVRGVSDVSGYEIHSFR